jgi:hypothetical protein
MDILHSQQGTFKVAVHSMYVRHIGQNRVYLFLVTVYVHNNILAKNTAHTCTELAGVYV